ncbi:hypothetical protein [Pseudonocardia spinosispora]|uniref:hypothetical protein n=1 Tax=Pseudonocardia spinosispora TaxID=103441 RepID=UPI00041D70CB|nr:hypothetical protein [Pseudonocardia spinosispora]
MSRIRGCLVVGAVAASLGLVGTAAMATPAVSYQAAQCPPGYTLNPQNTQQCVPSDQTGMTPGAPSPYGF